MEKNLIRLLFHVVLLAIGLVLMIGGIMTGKHGATVVGLCVSAVNIQQWIQWKKEEKTTIKINHNI